MSGSGVKQHVSPRLRNEEHTIHNVPACVLLSHGCISLSSASTLSLLSTTASMLTATGSGIPLRLEAASIASDQSGNKDSVSCLKS